MSSEIRLVSEKKRFQLVLSTTRGLVPLIGGFEKAKLLELKKTILIAMGIISDREP